MCKSCELYEIVKGCQVLYTPPDIVTHADVSYKKPLFSEIIVECVESALLISNYMKLSINCSYE